MKAMLSIFLAASLVLGGIMLMGPAESGDVMPNVLALTPHAPIRIDSDGDFPGIATAGDGSSGMPWVINNFEIDGTLSGNCIYVGNTTEYFIIQNCLLSNSSGLVSQPYWSDSGIVLHNVQNAHLLNNTIFNIIGKEGANGEDSAGIYLDSSSNNILEANTIFNITGGNHAPGGVPGTGWGILMDASSDNNKVLKNTISNIGTGSLVYFKDDMENGASKWAHSSTLALINGETPIEYYAASTVLDTDVMSDWNSTMSSGILNNNTEYHSFNESFYLEESVAGNINKTAVTDSFNLTNHDSAVLSFWHKYNLTANQNGVFLQVGYKNTTQGTVDDWDWWYVTPAFYTGNLSASESVNDTWENPITGCWNNVSGGGTYDWEYVEINLLDYVPAMWSDEVRVKFNYTQFGGGSGDGWYVDDVKITASRLENANVGSNFKDVWQITNTVSHSGENCWSNIDPITGNMKPGIDNYLTTVPIDLTSATDVDFTAYMRFNLNEDSGMPPDGFRVEITNDMGITWQAINLGMRGGWNVSGTGNDADDGIPDDGRTWSGLTDSGNPATDDYWVETGTLSRINANLSGFSGDVVQMRFRIVTSNNLSYQHNNSLNSPYPGFGGFYLDDVEVRGTPIIEILDGRGIGMFGSNGNEIYNNNISNCYYGGYISGSTNNFAYHNNFVNNTIQADDDGANFWDNGYPSGGNYWSDYSGVDDFYGPSQNIAGNDGFGDAAYTVAGGSNVDNYPLMQLYAGQPLGPSVAVPPIALNYTPNGTAEPVDVPIIITWNETMNWTSVEEAFRCEDEHETVWTGANGTWEHNSTTNASVFTPAEPFVYETHYVVTVNSSAADIIGNMLDQNGNGTGGEWPLDVLQWSFTTDDEAPYVVSTQPAHGQFDVDPHKPFKIVFSESMNRTAAEAAFSYTDGNRTWNMTDGAGYWNTPRTELTFDPAEPLAANTSFTVTLDGDVATDVGGKGLKFGNHTWDFSTWLEPPAPGVTSTYPPDGAFGVNVNSYINIVFDCEMDAQSVQDAFSYTDGTDVWTAGEGIVDWFSDNTLFSFQPTEKFGFDTEYTVTVSSDAMSVYGVNMDGNGNGIQEEDDDLIFGFTTTPEPPTVVSHYPMAGQRDVSTNLGAIYINFSIPMLISTVSNAVSITPNTPFTPTFSGGGQQLTLTLGSTLQQGVEYRITVLGTATDMTGMKLDGNGDGWPGDKFTFSFYTEGMEVSEPPRIVGIFPQVNSTIPVDSVYFMVSFNVAMNRTSAQNAFSIGDATGEVNGSFAWAGNGKSFRFTPSDNLAYNATYTVSVTGTARDVDGQAIENPMTWHYTTESEAVGRSLLDWVLYGVIIGLLALCTMLYMANRALRMNLKRTRVKLKRLKRQAGIKDETPPQKEDVGMQSDWVPEEVMPEEIPDEALPEDK